MFMDITNPFKMVLTNSTVQGVTIIQDGCLKWLLKAVFGYNFTIIGIESWILVVLTISAVPEVTINQDGCHEWLPKAFFGYNFKIIGKESWNIGNIFTNNCDNIMIFGSKYMFMGMRNLFLKDNTNSFRSHHFPKWLPLWLQYILAIISLIIIIISWFLGLNAFLWTQQSI